MPYHQERDNVRNLEVDAIVLSAQLGGMPMGMCEATLGVSGGRQTIFVRTPDWGGGGARESEQLRIAVVNALEVAAAQGFGSVAFPLLATRNFGGFPDGEAYRVIRDAICGFLDENGDGMDVYLATFSRAAVDGLAMEERREIAQYLFEHWEAKPEDQEAYWELKNFLLRTGEFRARSPEVQRETAFNAPLGEDFETKLYRLLREKNMNDTEVFRTVWGAEGRDKRNKMVNQNRSRTKENIVKIALAMHLSVDEALELLRTEGLTLSRSERYDMIIEACFANGYYDPPKIDSALYEHTGRVLFAET